MYDLDVVRARERKVATESDLALGEAVGPWWNPPLYAWVFAPLSRLSFSHALIVWCGINGAAAIAAIRLLGRLVPGCGALVAVLVLASYPFLQSLTHGQSSPTSLLLLTAIALAWRRGHDFATGALCALLFYKPQLAAVVSIILVLHRGARAAGGLLAVGGILLALTTMTMPGALSDYLHRLPPNLNVIQTESTYLWERHVTLKAFWRLLLQGRGPGETSLPVHLLTALTALPLAAALLAGAWRARHNARAADSVIAGAVAAAPLLMPFYFDYDLLLLAVPAVLSALHSRHNRWLLAGWSGLYLWLFVNPYVAGFARINLAVPLLYGVAGGLVVQLLRHEEAVREQPAKPSSLRKRLWLAGSGVALFILTLAVAGPLLDKDARDGKLGLGYDFLPAYVAGHFARTGQFHAMYDRVAFSEMQTRVIREANLEMDGRYGAGLNPPHFGLLFAPLSALPYRTAAAAWLAINTALLAASLTLLMRMLPPERSIRGLVPLLVLASMPFCQAMGHQQNTFLSLLLLTVAVTCWRSGSPFAAGIVLGLMFYKPQLAIVIALVLVAEQGWRAALGLGVTGAITLLVTVCFMPGALTEYFHSLPSNLDWIQNQHAYNWGRQVTFLGFGRLLFNSPTLARVLWIVGATTVGVALAAGFFRSRTAADRATRRDRLIAAAIASTPLLIPYYLDYDLLLLAVPAVLLAGELARPGDWAKADRWMLRAWVALYLWSYLNPGVSGMIRVSLTVPLVAAVVAGLIARCLRRERELETEEQSAAEAAPTPMARAA